MRKVSVPLLMGLRYLRAKRRNGFISFISWISMICIALGVWALITVISIMNGFGSELRGRILDVASHITIKGQNYWLSDWEKLRPQLDANSSVKAYAPYINGQGLMSYQSRVSGVLVRGVDPKYEIEVSAIAQQVEEGSIETLQPSAYNIILGEGLAAKLGVLHGDKVTLISPQGSSSPIGITPKLRRFTVSGFFSVGMSEYDNNLALINLRDASKLFKTRDLVSGVRLKVDDAYKVPSISAALSKQLDYQYWVDNWTRQHGNFFRALKIERRVMFIILFLIVAVAAFNIVSTLVMVVVDKRADIAVLRTIGLSPSSVMGVFFVQGAVFGIIGTLIGTVLGVLTALNVPVIVPFIENIVGHQLFPDDVYVISDFPAELRWADVSIIVSVSMLISMLVTLYPARKAAKTQPAEALRYE